MHKLDIPSAPPGPGMGQELVRLGTEMLALKGTITAAEMRALAKYLTQAGAQHQRVVLRAQVAIERMVPVLETHPGVVLPPVIGVVS